MSDDLNQADRVLHSLAQFIALTAMQWLPPRADDGQTNVGWNSDRQWLEGRPFVYNGQPIRLVIDTASFALRFVDNQENTSAWFALESQTPADAMTWWKSQMQVRGIVDIRGLNYRLDQEPIPLQTVYQRPSGLKSWGRWRTVANSALSGLTAWSGQTSEVRIWPHHFDTGVYYALTDAHEQETAAIWAGYAMADAVCREPYFYLSGYKRGEAIDFGLAPALSVGWWRNEPDWTGALLPVSAIVNPDVITPFLRESYAWLNHTIHYPA